MLGDVVPHNHGATPQSATFRIGQALAPLKPQTASGSGCRQQPQQKLLSSKCPAPAQPCSNQAFKTLSSPPSRPPSLVLLIWLQNTEDSATASLSCPILILCGRHNRQAGQICTHL